jgi:hypothetical protein
MTTIGVIVTRKAGISLTSPTCQPERTGLRTKRPLNGPIFASSRMSGAFENSPLSGTEKHPDFQVTLCLHFVTTDVKFAYIKSE